MERQGAWIQGRWVWSAAAGLLISVLCAALGQECGGLLARHFARENVLLRTVCMHTVLTGIATHQM